MRPATLPAARRVRYAWRMAAAARAEGPVKAWIEPDRLAFARAFPGQMALFLLSVVGSAALAYALHPLFWGAVGFLLLRQASLEASLRELFREGMLHPAQLVPGGLMATLVRLEGEGGTQDAVVISRAPWRWRRGEARLSAVRFGAAPPWGGERAAVVVAGEPPALKPLSPDLAGIDERRARLTVDRIPEGYWQALTRALSQLHDPGEGLHPVQLGAEPWYGKAGESLAAEAPEPLSRDQTSIWCAALPCIEEPAMLPEERRRVLGLRRRALWVSAGWAAGALLALAVLGVSGVAARHAPLLSLLGLASLLAAPLSLVAALRGLFRASAYAADLAEGRVLRFGGVLSDFDSLALDPDLALLFRRGLLTADSSMQEELVVLPKSGQLLYANKGWAPPSLVLSVRRVADPPRDPVRLSLPRDFEPQRYDATVNLARRRLTSQETSELSDYMRSLRRPGRGFWLVLAFVAVALGAWHSEGFRLPPTSVGVPLALLASCVAAWSTVRRFRLAARLDNDIELGWVLTVDRAAQTDAPRAELPVLGVETLLHAQLDWTVNRRPAAWRRLGGL
jgi:hypothetical protein